jgi:hypothetical protein
VAKFLVGEFLVAKFLVGEFGVDEFLVGALLVGPFFVGEKDGPFFVGEKDGPFFVGEKDGVSVSSSLFTLLLIGFPDPFPGFNLGEKEAFPSCLLLWGLALKGLGVIQIKMGMGKTPTSGDGDYKTVNYRC